MSIQTTRPQNRREFMDKLIVPYDPRYGNPNDVFSEPQKLGQPEQNRALEISLKNDLDKDFSIGIKDINEAVHYYFTEVLKLSVVQNNTRVPVPIIYGHEENWNAVQANGYYRDNNSKLLAPLLMFKRTNITQNRGLANKLDANSVKNVQVFEKTFSRRNVYSNFSAINNRVPEKEYVVAMSPDYVTVEYSCMIWTHFVEQMDKLIESLNYASRAYWGDPNKFQFYSSIESFQDATTFDTGDDRLIRSNFNMTLNGYLIPDSINKSVSVANRVYGVSNIVFGLETSTGIETFNASINKPASAKLSNVIAADSQNIVINQTINTSGVSQTVLDYVNARVQKTGAYNNNTTIIFNGFFLPAPTGFAATSAADFTFFCNGQLVEASSVVSFTQNAGQCTLVIDPAQLSYEFEPTDEVIAIGKFA
jgi:hypothetical protein